MKNENKKLKLNEVSEVLGITKSAVKQKAMALRILHREETTSHYYMHEDDLRHFQIDYRKGENRQKFMEDNQNRQARENLT